MNHRYREIVLGWAAWMVELTDPKKREETTDAVDHSKAHHSYFFGEDVVYKNARTTTRIQRVPIKEPIVDGEPEHPSREEMLNAEVERRIPLNGPIKPTIDHVCYSDIPRQDMRAKIKLSKSMLGLNANSRFYFTNRYFHQNELEGKTYRDSQGISRQVHHAIAASKDRSTDSSMMARVLHDKNGSIFYGGRADNATLAKQQGIDIFLEERQLGKIAIPQDERGVYHLTYVVNSLTNGGTLQNPSLLNERAALLNEIAALKTVDGQEISIQNGKEECKVQLHPIHVHHTLSFWSRFTDVLPDDVSGLEIERSINDTGYQKLIEHAQRLNDNRAKDIINILEDKDRLNSLAVHERLFLVDFLSKLCGIPIVHHCKSVIDRTSIAAGISTVNHLLIHNSNHEWNSTKPYSLCHKHHYKHLFLSALNIQHQVSKDARIGIHPNGKIKGSKKLGLNYQTNRFRAIPSALQLLPKSAVKKSRLTRIITPLLPVATLLLTPIYIGIVVPTATLYFSYKSNKWQGEFGYQMACLPFRVNWWNLGKIDISKTFDFDSPEINGRKRALLIGAKTSSYMSRMSRVFKPKEDPRYRIMPKHLHPTIIPKTSNSQIIHNKKEDLEEID